MSRYDNSTVFNAIQVEAESIYDLYCREFDYPRVAPVPVESIAKELFGFTCEARDLKCFGQDTVGALSQQARRIYLSRLCNWRQYVFAVTHEIGHWVLHEENSFSGLYGEGNEFVPTRQILATGRPRRKKEEAQLKEFEANLFAGALLTPCSLLLGECKRYAVIDSEALSELAFNFGVSREAMLRRIEALERYRLWKGPALDECSLQELKKALLKPSPDQSTSNRYFARKRHPLDSRVQSKPKISKANRTVVSQLAEMLDKISATPTSALSETEPTNAEPSPSEQEKIKLLADFLRKKRGEQVARGDGDRPTIIEFSGTSNAGKDTIINALRDYLEDVHEYKVRVIYEADKTDCNIDKQLVDERLHKTIARVVDSLYEACYENPGRCDFVIFNRGLFDRMVILRALGSCGRIPERYEFANMEMLASKAHLQDVTIVFLISPEESLQREWDTRRKYVTQLFIERDLPAGEKNLADQRLLNPEMLAILNYAYLEIFEKFGRTAFNGQVHLFKSKNGIDFTIMEKLRAVSEIIFPATSNLSMQPCNPTFREPTPIQLPLPLEEESVISRIRSASWIPA